MLVASSPRTRIGPFASLAVVRFDSPEGREALGFGLALTLVEAMRGESTMRIVPASASLARFDSESPDEIGRHLNVDAVLAGTVSVATEIEVVALLVDPRSEREVWTQRYLGRTGEVGEIVRDIAETVLGKPARRRGRAARGPAIDTWDAFAAYAEARWLQWFGFPSDLARVAEFLEKATRGAPAFAPAAAALAHVSAVLALEEGAGSPRLATAIAAAENALRHDPSLAEARAALGIALVAKGDIRKGETQLRRAAMDDPLFAPAHTWLAMTLLELGRLEEAARELRWAQMVAPGAGSQA